MRVSEQGRQMQKNMGELLVHEGLSSFRVCPKESISPVEGLALQGGRILVCGFLVCLLDSHTDFSCGTWDSSS